MAELCPKGLFHLKVHAGGPLRWMVVPCMMGSFHFEEGVATQEGSVVFNDRHHIGIIVELDDLEDDGPVAFAGRSGIAEFVESPEDTDGLVEKFSRSGGFQHERCIPGVIKCVHERLKGETTKRIVYPLQLCGSYICTAPPPLAEWFPDFRYSARHAGTSPGSASWSFEWRPPNLLRIFLTEGACRRTAPARLTKSRRSHPYLQ
ncbi:uncharacterized protein EDB91DRAFT_1137071 [Suillus paluster]|uniref:uncharacterized protein n=1 Tax=Suillus paluster TaxID=48578 RepID=UPI001B86F680|nr:uncharacterized protein EDB91DRAFT_1137071 [Suillus paluster]KAG1738880.1 hypothetical protein EDB91DRAFT_1137071 [Suillus paluster]